MPAVTKKCIQKIVLWGMAACGVLLAVLIGLVMWVGSTEPIESVAKTFKPGPDWQQVQYRVEPPRVACLSGACPEVSVSWRLRRPINNDEFEAFLGDLSTTEVRNNTCLGKIDDKAATSCGFEGVRGGYYTMISVFKDREDQDGKFTRVGLFIRKE